MARKIELKDSKVDSIGEPTLIFPSDMEKKYYPEAIKFSIYERGGVSYETVRETMTSAFNASNEIYELGKDAVFGDGEVTSSGSSTIADGIGNGSSGTNDPAKTAAERAKKDKFDNLKRATDDLKTNASNLGKEITNLNEVQSLEKTVERHKQSIYLQMPDAISFAESVEWASTDLGLIGGLKSGTMGASDALEYGVMGNLGTIIGGAAGGMAAMAPGISGIASSVIGAALGEGSGLQAGINNALNVQTNPFKEQTFQGIGFRPFEFSFTFRPRSEAETYVVDDIVRSFRQYSKPTFLDTTKAGFFKYPHEFRIEFLTIDDNESYVTNEYIPEIKFCVCTGVNVNFTQQGWRSFEDGAPQSLQLQLTFSETELITGEDVAGNTNVGRFKDYGGRF